MSLEDKVGEIQSFYQENTRDLTWYGADDDPEKLLEYKKKVGELVEEARNQIIEAADEYDAAQEYANTLEEGLRDELEVATGSPEEGRNEPNFERARGMLGV